MFGLGLCERAILHFVEDLTVHRLEEVVNRAFRCPKHVQDPVGVVVREVVAELIVAIFNAPLNVGEGSLPWSFICVLLHQQDLQHLFFLVLGLLRGFLRIRTFRRFFLGFFGL